MGLRTLFQLTCEYEVMKRCFVFLLLTFLVSSCILFLYDYDGTSMEGHWYVKNLTDENLKISWFKGEPLQILDSVLLESGDSVMIFSAVGNSYMTPSFEAFKSIDCIFLSIDDDDSQGNATEIWRSQDGVEGHCVFNELSWSRYSKFGQDTWVFGIIEQDISSLRGVDSN